MSSVPLMLNLLIVYYIIFALKGNLFCDTMIAWQLGTLTANQLSVATFVIKLLTEELKFILFSMNHCQVKNISLQPDIYSRNSEIWFLFNLTTTKKASQ